MMLPCSTLRASLAVFLLLATTMGCAPKSELLDSPIVGHIKRGVTSGQKTFDHSGFDALLKAHVDPKSFRVNYGALKKDRNKLEAYLQSLAVAKLSEYGRDENMALLINAYNAYTLKLIIERYPNLNSIRDIDDPWGTKRYKVGGEVLSLDNIEHGLLRPMFKDPRIHFVVNCASIGCPPIRPGAFTGKGLDAQLDEQTRTTLQSPQYVRVDGEVLKLTKIMDWYGKDFTRDDFKNTAKSVPAYVAKYATPEVNAFLTKHTLPQVEFLTYDWKLNDMKQ